MIVEPDITHPVLAETKVTPVGKGTEITTPVAADAAVLLKVIIYTCVPHVVTVLLSVIVTLIVASLHWILH
jgi:hypothetical protein